ncbi:hypothetical protein BC938DRAFT_482763 [Jimgerdemannia flammicorona]|uniref:Uncharacterized protein n=1 Tax=Jimgerdemannia flammicorona TaxID=994334 RepID=A0A433QDB5_9FUNG|nr:hypothetical protein BC938DRAFT_482763 [Jimgerdemannia flammicorona]
MDNLFTYYQQELLDCTLQRTYDILNKDLRLVIDANYFGEDIAYVLRRIKDGWSAWKKECLQQIHKRANDAEPRKIQFQSSVTKYQKGVAAVVDAEVNKWVEEAAKGDVEDVTTKRPHEFSESDDEQALSRKVQRKDVQIEDSEEEDRMYAEAAEVAAEKLRDLQLVLSSGTFVKDILASRKKDNLSFKYQMLIDDSTQPGFNQDELNEIKALSVRHMAATAVLQKKALIVKDKSVTLGDPQEDMTTSFLVEWMCKATEKFDSGRLETDMSEGTYIIRYLGYMIDGLFADCQDIELEWGEKALVASTQNRNMLDSTEEDDHGSSRQRIGKKSDCIGFRITARREDREELLVVEVVGPPSRKNEKKNKHDRRELLKGMKLALDRIVSNVGVEKVRRMCVYGLLVYGFTLTVYKCQLQHYRVYTTTVVDKLSIPTTFDHVKYLDKMFRVLIRVKLDMYRLIEELKDAAWESDKEEGEEIDLRQETVPTPRKTRKKM